MSVYDWIETRIPGGHSSRLGSFLDVAFNIEYGEETQRQGAVDLLGFSTGNGSGSWWVYGKSDERWKVNGGNQQIALAQADYVGWQSIQLGWRLVSLKANPAARRRRPSTSAAPPAASPPTTSCWPSRSACSSGSGRQAASTRRSAATP